MTPAPQQRSKASVHYGPSRPKGDHCGICIHFHKPDSCELVAGEVRSSMWCELFARKPSIRK